MKNLLMIVVLLTTLLFVSACIPDDEEYFGNEETTDTMPSGNSDNTGDTLPDTPNTDQDTADTIPDNPDTTPDQSDSDVPDNTPNDNDQTDPEPVNDDDAETIDQDNDSEEPTISDDDMQPVADDDEPLNNDEDSENPSDNDLTDNDMEQADLDLTDNDIQTDYDTEPDYDIDSVSDEDVEPDNDTDSVSDYDIETDDDDADPTPDEDADAETEPPECYPGITTVCKDSSTSSNLIWSTLSSDKFKLADAETYCNTLNEGGYPTGSWKLPNINDLKTLILNCDRATNPDQCKVSDPDCLSSGTDCYDNIYCNNTNVCKSNSSGSHSKLGDNMHLWSSSKCSDNDTYAFMAMFLYGTIGKNKTNNTYNVRCVIK